MFLIFSAIIVFIVKKNAFVGHPLL